MSRSVESVSFCVKSPERLRHTKALLPAVWLLLAALAQGAEEPVGRWTAAGELSTGRYAPGAALLPDGRVLVAGGYSFEARRTHATSDLFAPADNSWSEGPRMRFDRNFPLVLPLSEGDALFVAGFRGRAGTTATAERLEGRRARFLPDGAPPALEERELASVTPLADGRFLIAGGYSTVRRRTLDSAEIYEPKGDRFVPVTGRLSHVRFGHTGALLPDGRVLIVGGKVLETSDDVLPAELFDPARGSFTDTGSLSAGRDRCTAWLLPDRARVLVAGGSAKEGGTEPARRAEIYTVATGRFNSGAELVRDRMAHTMTPLPDGRVLLVGGWCGSEKATTRQAEVWDPVKERFLPAGTMQAGRHDHVAVLLKDGRVLVAGGKEAPAREGVESPTLAEIWSPG